MTLLATIEAHTSLVLFFSPFLLFLNKPNPYE